ncbi:MAG: NAD-binding oxidoreductase [Myxococcota bacterium]
MSGWSRAALIENEVLTTGLHRISLAVTAEVAGAFHAPGQYHRVRVPAGNARDSMFAIASAPGGARFEYLIRASGSVAEAWARLPVGAEVEVSRPEGKGFPLELARGRTVLAIGTGTGFAPLRSALLAIRARRAEFGRVHALYGAHSPAHLAWRQELTALVGEEIHVTPTVSERAEGWTGELGRVQHLVERLPVEDAVVFLCGQAEMVADVTRALATRGVPPERVFLNF